MNTKVLYTSIFGPFDQLPVVESTTPGWDYICFTPEKDLQRTKDYQKKWKIIDVPRRFRDDSRNSRIYKIIPHKMQEMLQYEYSFWIDANTHIPKCDLNEKTDEIFCNDLSVYSHPSSVSDAYAEGDRCICKKKDDRETIEKQLNKYRFLAYPDRTGVCACYAIFRNHFSVLTQSFCDCWFSEIAAGSKRDQISFSYVKWKFENEGYTITTLKKGTEFFNRGPHNRRIKK